MLPQTKNGDGRVVYLNDMAMMVFRSVGWNEETKLGNRITAVGKLDAVFGSLNAENGENVTKTLAGIWRLAMKRL